MSNGTASESEPKSPPLSKTDPPALKKLAPYWYPYTTMAKERWLGREILEIVSTEFRDRSMEYYRYALESGVTTINGKVARPDTVVRNGDRIENVVHRHEPPVTSTPVKIVLHDKERDFLVIDKPGSIPVHASGRYYRHSLVEILHNEFHFPKIFTINRLDRLTSGLMIIPLNADLARSLSAEFVNGLVRKEYVARCRGEFPAAEITCEEPLLTVDRQMGLNIVHPDGKHAKTIFNRLHYDPATDTSVLRCRPMTGRSHQIRVHLQYLGHPIANDPVYSEERIWGTNLGKGGVDVIPCEHRAAPAPPPHLLSDDSPEALNLKPSDDTDSPIPLDLANEGDEQSRVKLLPRETGHDIGMGSPVPLSSEAVGIIIRLRNMKDEDEDWSRWRDVVFRAKGTLTPKDIPRAPLPPQNRRKKGGPSLPQTPIPQDTSLAPQLTQTEALTRLSQMEAPPPAVDPVTGTLYCSECYLPLHPDPKPEKLYIFLHALRYTTSLGCFETDMPEWAAEGWKWDQA
ncbi:pseudouridine synthase [Rhizopogon vinicolor AM-OR11-026]|uniref:Pseudouridine synthase n=1 Tax=Rhizopogon vinicolor AM-OR11-026 TaxID=1314800 RepID=A0A1B7MYV7_9AGAM|nr:pseudouridine synthase [Rhizopogon vinicolor AM-OR11-026]